MKKSSLNVLTLTSLFPNQCQPYLGIFVKERVAAVSELCNLKVVAPVPWFPPLKIFRRWYPFSQVPRREIQEGIEVIHPRFLVIPKVMRSLCGILYFISVFPRILRIRQRFDFDLIDVHWAYPDGFAGVLLGKIFHKPVTITVRGTDINLYTKYFLRRKIIIFTLRNAGRVIAVSAELKRKILGLGIPEEKVEVISNGVDTKKFKPIDRFQAKNELGLPQDKTIILSVGNLVKSKGFQYLIDAVSNLIREGRSNTFLVIVGNGEYRNELKRQIGALQMTSFVRLIGSKPHKELFKWYSASDLFCLASETEGYPNVLLEALACGVPVVATNIGGIPEIIHSSEYGILVNGQNGNNLVCGINEALKKEWNAEKLIEYARQNTWNKVAEKVYCEFEALINGDVVD